MLLLSSSPVLTLARRVIRRRGVGDPAFCGTSVTRTSPSRCSAFVGGSMTAQVHLLPAVPLAAEPPAPAVRRLPRRHHGAPARPQRSGFPRAARPPRLGLAAR